MAEMVTTDVAFRLKANLFTLTILQLQTDDLGAIEQLLLETTKRTPKLFVNMPLVIDLQKINRNRPGIDLPQLISLLKRLQFIPVGVRGGTTTLNEQALSVGLAIMPASQETATASNSEATLPSPTQINATAVRGTSKVITKPVRSGQQIYAEGGDLIILAAVSHGAELLADGNIHVYGALRGRALAGINGDNAACIICQELDAELIAIAGNYMTKEDLKKYSPPDPGFTHIYIENGQLHITRI